MDSHTCLEDLSNEIFFEIFDYLHALDIFTAFTSLNKRISSILQIIPLRVIISDDHRRHHVDYLSSHLTFHAHQVISVDIFDKILDDSSIVSLFFNQHKFINLQSCTFISVNPSTKLENVFKQIKSLNRLVSISVIQPKYENLNKNTKNDLLQTIFTHNSSHLRSIALGLPYDYLDISKCTWIPSNLKSLFLTISSSILNISVYSILPIFRLCHSIQNLSIILTGSLLFEENNK
jgi:anti-anti-sigma regulatory factor